MSTENLKNQSQQSNKREADASNSNNQRIETPQRSEEQRAGAAKDQKGSGYSQGGKRSDD